MNYCKLCQKEITGKTNSPNKAFCSRACLSKHRRVLGLDLVKKKCVVCHETFEADKSKHKNRQTCSRSCGNHLAWHDGKGKLKMIKIKPKNCAQCEKEFFSKDKIVKYCSSDCISKARIERNKSKPKPTKQVKKCEICENEHKNKRYCSNLCSIAGRKRKDKKNHIWSKMNKIIKKGVKNGK